MDSEKRRWADFPQLECCGELERYFESRQNYGSTGRKFYHYTSLEALNQILESGELRLSPVARANDKREQAIAKDEKEYPFLFCLGSGVNENLTLWYLYADRGREGVRIQFTGKMLEELKRCPCEVSWYDFSDNKEVSARRPLAAVTRELRDVLYYRSPGYARPSACDLKYSTMTNYGKVSPADFAQYEKRHPLFCKKIVWFYEKETRFLAKIPPAAFEGLELSEPRKEKVYPALWVKLNDRILKGLKIQLAPQCPDWHGLQRDGKYASVWHALGETPRIQDSAYRGEVEIDLCSRCSEKGKTHEEAANK